MTNKNVTIEMILEKKGLIQNTPNPFCSKFFNGNIVVENTHPQAFMQALANVQGDETYAYSRLIYENCPIFREKQLLKEFEVDDPYLLPKKVYGSNIVEFLELGNYILSLYGYDNETVQNIKKK